MVTTSFRRLPSGEWGVQIKGGPRPCKGQRYNVRRSNGSAVRVTIDAVIDEGYGAFLCTFTTSKG